jgi:hypothetical protein
MNRLEMTLTGQFRHDLDMRVAPILAVLVAGCAGGHLPQDTRPDLDNSALTSTCCQNLERFPDWMVDIAEATPSLTPWMGTVEFRSGFLAEKPAAWKIVTPALRPLDIMLFHSDGRLSSRLIPGHFSHGALYLGTEAQLRDIGIWQAAWFAPFRSDIRAGRNILDSVTGGVRLTSLAELSDTDAVGVVRPSIDARARNGRIHREVLSTLGVPFDFDFDSGDDSRLFCIELIAQAMPELHLPEIEAYGRQTIVPDSIAAIALSGDGPLSFVGYLRGETRGWRTSSARLMALDLRDAWNS